MTFSSIDHMIGHRSNNGQKIWYIHMMEYYSACCCSVIQLCLTLCDPIDYSTSHCLSSSPSCSSSCSLSRWCHPTIWSSVILFSCLQSFQASRSIPMSWFFCIREPKYWGFRFSISPPSEYPGLISFSTVWFDLLAVQETLKNLLKHHSQFFASGGQSIGVSASASVFPMNIQDWFPLGWTGWISLLSKGL